ncbi:MAG: hypothetical protein J6Y17_00240 [Elusimicrobiaceae bacterium]|nr:hypothetical protein [Elusimicrobiaceae bacterium]
MKNLFATLGVLSILACCTLLNAQETQFVKQLLKKNNLSRLSETIERKIVSATYVPNAYVPKYWVENSPKARERALAQKHKSPSSIPVLTDKPVALADAQGHQKAQHSIMPSAVTVLGSPAIKLAEERAITFLRRQAQETTVAEYIPPLERERWRDEFEALRALYIKAEPTSPEDLPQHFTHQVPPATAAYLQKEYAKLVQLIEQTNKDLMPKVVYSFLLNEGKNFSQEERVFINKSIDAVRTQGAVLLKAINTDPYLLVQRKYWNRMFGAFNPLLKGVLAKPTSIFRQDKREFVFQEFALHNPDGSAPYLPNSKTMIAGEDEEDDDFDEEQYAGQQQDYRRRAARMAQERQHKAAMIKLAEAERDELIARLPANLHIAVINDDRLPLVNFEYWAKNGWLGKNATVSTFQNGFNFMKQIKRGVRYDIVITDLVLPDGGVSMMENFRILDSNAIVFASSKFYPGDGDDHSARDLFNFGMDGYIWNNTNLNEGSFGYLQYLRQLNNYYYYKNKYSWDR